MLHSRAGFLTCIAPQGFTLAEVLVTLGIIGIVAALTMPALVAKYQEKVTVTKLKKFYSVMSQAYAQAIAENGTPDNWGLIGNNSPEGAENLTNTLVQYLKVLKNCGTTEPGCAPDTVYKYSDGTNNTGPTANYTARMILADGAFVYSMIRSENCTNVRGAGSELQNICSAFYIDTNGDKPPNISGQDLFLFYFTKNSIMPAGTQEETNWPFTRCLAMGLGCSAWLIYNENMDYLHCDNLSWDGPAKCN